MLLYVHFSLIENCQDHVLDVVFCESFKSPLQERLVKHGKENLWACTAQRPQPRSEAACKNYRFQVSDTEPDRRLIFGWLIIKSFHGGHIVEGIAS